MFTLDLSDKTGLIFGVANRRSIAMAIAEQLDQAGARLAFTYQGERFRETVEGLTEGMHDPLLMECDVSRDEDLERTFETVREEFGTLDYLVHSVAFALREDLEGNYRNTSRRGFLTALEISAFSLLPMARLAAPLMKDRDGSIVALSYLGAERAIPGYNVMGTAKAALEQAVKQLALDLGPEGVRVNAISAGPINTVSARGVSGFSGILKVYDERTPLKRNITQEEVGKAALFLLTDMASGITGTTLHVDAGFHITAI
jgi:enoyl-[acyl-carrier protein] reductase I